MNGESLDSPIRIPFDYTDMPVDEFWGSLGRITDGNEVPLFGTVCKFMKCLLALPHSSADAERLFSAVALIKSKSRNRLNTDTVTALLLAKEGVKRLISYRKLYKRLPST